MLHNQLQPLEELDAGGSSASRHPARMRQHWMESTHVTLGLARSGIAAWYWIYACRAQHAGIFAGMVRAGENSRFAPGSGCNGIGYDARCPCRLETRTESGLCFGIVTF